jgi:SAM-dependent methyltransferase
MASPIVGAAMTTELRYVLDNAAQETARRFSSLETLFDRDTRRHLDATGVGSGWRCLELGAGGGSVARWLSARVGPSGRVLATDIDPRWLDVHDLGNVEVRRHRIPDDPLPEAEFDLVHARLVLVHVPGRAEALRQLVAALRPGGWLVLEDFDTRLFPYCPEAASADEELANRAWDAFVTHLEAGGVDGAYGRRLPRLLREAGLVDVEAEGRLAMGPGGSPVADLMLANLDQVGGALVGCGLLTADEVERFASLLSDPSFFLNVHLMVSARGRRP